jgi:predicted RNase H-like HicB family nuclease
MGHTFRVEAEYDNEAGVWYVSASDVPGLATEASSLDELMAKLVDVRLAGIDTKRSPATGPPTWG